MNCPYCNYALPPDVSKCPICGGLAETPIANIAVTDKNKNINLLSVVLGVCSIVCLLAGLWIGLFGGAAMLGRFIDIRIIFIAKSLFYVIAPPVGITGLIFGIKNNCKLGIVLNVIGWGGLWIRFIVSITIKYGIFCMWP